MGKDNNGRELEPLENDLSDVVYFSYEWAIRQHEMVLRESGGLSGVLDEGQLKGVLSFIQEDRYYPYFTDKLVHLLYAVCMFHMFTDANKRTAIALGAYFLKINGYESCIDRFMIDMEKLVVMLVEHTISEEDFSEYVACIIYEADYPPNLEGKIRKQPI